MRLGTKSLPAIGQMAHSAPKLLRVCKDSGWSQNLEPPQRLCPKFDLDKAGSLSTLEGILGDKPRAKIVYFRTTTYQTERHRRVIREL